MFFQAGGGHSTESSTDFSWPHIACDGCSSPIPGALAMVASWGSETVFPKAKGFQVSRRFHGFVVGPLGSSETSRPTRRDAAFRNFDSGDFGQIQGNHVDSLGWSNMSSQRIWKVRIGTDWWAWHWIGRFLRVWNSFPQGKRFSGVEKVPWICCWTPLQFRNPASRREVRHSGDSWADSGGSVGFIWVGLTCFSKDLKG